MEARRLFISEMPDDFVECKAAGRIKPATRWVCQRAKEMDLIRVQYLAPIIATLYCATQYNSFLRDFHG
jgi:hypothetical protein